MQAFVWNGRTIVRQSDLWQAVRECQTPEEAQALRVAYEQQVVPELAEDNIRFVIAYESASPEEETRLLGIFGIRPWVEG